MRVRNLFKNDYSISFILFFGLNVLIFLPIFFGKVNLNGNLLVTYYSFYQKLLPFKDTGWDQIRFFFPNLKFVYDSLRTFTLPLWDPYIFSGHPQLANLQSAVFYPLNIFAFFLSLEAFWNFMRFIPYTLGAWFSYIYLKNLYIKPMAAFFGSLTFGFSLLMLTWGEEVVILPHSIIWLPLILFSIDKFISSKNKKFLFLFSISISFSIFAGFIQSVIYILILLIFYTLNNLGWRKCIKQNVLFPLCFSILIALLICAIQLLPSVELFFNSTRSLVSGQSLTEFLIPPDNFITYLAPDFFGNPATRNVVGPKLASYYERIYFVGLAALIFAIFAICIHRKNKIVKFYSITIFISLFLTSDLLIAKLQLLLPIPFISTAIPNRILFIPTFSFSVLAALGLNHFLQYRSRNIEKISIWILIVYFVIAVHLIIIIFFKLNYYKQETSLAVVSLRNLLLPFIVFIFVSLLLKISNRYPFLKRTSVLLIIMVSVLHILFMAKKYMSFSEMTNTYPSTEVMDFLQKNQGLYRSWSATDDRTVNNIFLPYNIYSPEGYDPANNRLYAEFIGKMKATVTGPYNRAVAEIGLAESLAITFEDGPKRRLINLLGIKYVIIRKTDEKLIKNLSLKKAFEDSNENGLTVYENDQVLPRTFLVSEYEVINSKDEFHDDGFSKTSRLVTDRIKSPSFNYTDKLILAKHPKEIPQKTDYKKAEIISYKPQEVIIKTNSTVQNLLFLSDTYYPGWQVKIDGYEDEVLKADNTFRAVAVPSGEHFIKFYFESQSLKIGRVVSLIGIILLIGYQLQPMKSVNAASLFKNFHI